MRWSMELKALDLQVEKIAYSAFYMTRLEGILRNLAIDKGVGGIGPWWGGFDGARCARPRISRPSVSTAATALDDATKPGRDRGRKPVERIATIAGRSGRDNAVTSSRFRPTFATNFPFWVVGGGAEGFFRALAAHEAGRKSRSSRVHPLPRGRPR